MKLRTKFLVSLLLILLGLTGTTLVVVKQICETQIRRVLLEDLNSSVRAFKTFERDREAHLMRASALMASQPSLRALMTTHDRKTIQDGSADLRALVGSDLLVLCDRDGTVMAVHGAKPDMTAQLVSGWSRESRNRPQDRKWWFVAGHLFEVFSQPIYFGLPSDQNLLGVLTVGYEIGDQVAADVGTIASSQVAFQYGQQIAASSFSDRARGQFQSTTSTASGVSDITIAGEHFLLTSVPLAAPPFSVRLVVFKSLDAARSFIRIINRVLVSLGFVAVLVGCVLVFAISHKFTRPLDELLAGVRAIHNQEFDDPLDSSEKDEFATLTRAFDQMRSGLTRAQEQLLDAVRLATIGRMASSISHDLRHRLTAVVANAEFLADEDLSRQRRQEFYNEVATAVRGMTDLLDSMVELSRPPQSLQLQLVSVHTVVRKALEAIRSHPRWKHVDIGVQCSEDIHGWFDPKRLERLFYNLILNACEILPKISGQIKIGVCQYGENIEIRVTDNGPGVPECIRDSLFQPFVSFGKQNGSGLGLAIVQKCCHDHGGKAVLETSSPGHTTFYIVLPIDRANSRHAEIANPSRARVQGALYEV